MTYLKVTSFLRGTEEAWRQQKTYLTCGRKTDTWRSRDSNPSSLLPAPTSEPCSVMRKANPDMWFNTQNAQRGQDSAPGQSAERRLEQRVRAGDEAKQHGTHAKLYTDQPHGPRRRRAGGGGRSRCQDSALRGLDRSPSSTSSGKATGLTARAKDKEGPVPYVGA